LELKIWKKKKKSLLAETGVTRQPGQYSLFAIRDLLFNRINEKFPGLVSYQELGESSSSGVKTYTIQIQIRATGGGQKFKGTGRNKKLARAKASLAALQHLFSGEF
jgi:CRISPR/Cas system-associated protein Cas7 (RAMP superfamily)